MTAPKAIVDTLAALRSERGPLAARLDAIDLAIENLSRVYGISGTPQPLPMTRLLPKKPRAVKEDGDAMARRETLLAVIGRADLGLTLSQLRNATPKMDGKDRSNALQSLKALGKIKRDGNAWRAA